MMTYNNNLKHKAQSSTSVNGYYTRLEVLTAVLHLGIYVQNHRTYSRRQKP
jgi:hypothetical protein